MKSAVLTGILMAVMVLAGCEDGVFTRGEQRSAGLGSGDGEPASDDGLPEGADDDASQKGNGKGNGKDEPMTEEEKAKEGKKEEDLCTKKYADAQYIHVTGNESVETVVAMKTLIAKVSGNQSQLTIDVSQNDIEAICLIAVGNQSAVTVNISKKVGAVYYRGLGNQSNTKMTVTETGAIGGMTVRVGGNQSVLAVSGDGAITCDAAPNVHGNNASYTCP